MVYEWCCQNGDATYGCWSNKQGMYVVCHLQHVYHGVNLQVEPFLLAAEGVNLRERERRKELLRLRQTWITMAITEEELPEHLTLPYIK